MRFSQAPSVYTHAYIYIYIYAKHVKRQALYIRTACKAPVAARSHVNRQTVDERAMLHDRFFNQSVFAIARP